MNSLAAKLSATFILVVVLGVASVSILVRTETTRGFESYLDAQGGNYLSRISVSLTALYQQEGDWRNAQSLMSGLLRGPGDRLVLADTAGIVIADTGAELNGQPATAVEALNQTPVTMSGNRVGTLYLLAFTQGPATTIGRNQGAGQGRGMGQMAGVERGKGNAEGTGPDPVSLEAAYLASVDRAILTAACLSALVAIAVGLIFSRRITRPLAELASASQEVASGRLDRRLKVTSKDELGKVASSFNAMAENLQRNEQARRHMVADIAHDLRTPITVIQGTVDGILDGVMEPDQNSLESIKEETVLLTKLVADLRTLSIAEAGQIKLEKTEVDLLEFVRRSVAKIEPIARKRGISCLLEGETPGPVAEIDVTRMGQVLGNLLDNALRYTSGGGKVTVSVVRGEGQTALLSVEDTGTGISPEELPKIFDRFYRADASRSRKSGGSGLGLAIVKQLVDAHGGRVWAESQPGSGTRFTVELPL